MDTNSASMNTSKNSTQKESSLLCTIQILFVSLPSVMTC